MIIDQWVSTVPESQVLENWLYIYNPGRRSLQNRQIGSNSVIYGVLDLFVLSIRAKQNVIYVARMEYMMENWDTWQPAIRYIQGGTAGTP